MPNEGFEHVVGMCLYFIPPLHDSNGGSDALSVRSTRSRRIYEYARNDQVGLRTVVRYHERDHLDSLSHTVNTPLVRAPSAHAP